MANNYLKSRILKNYHTNLETSGNQVYEYLKLHGLPSQNILIPIKVPTIKVGKIFDDLTLLQEPSN
jgi:hypothetical protein